MVWQNWITLFITCIIFCITLIPKVRSFINNLYPAKGFGVLWEALDKKSYKYIVLIFMFIGTVVRLWKFGIIPSGFNQDGAMGAVDALALAHHATDRFGMWLPVHFTAWGFGQMSVLLSYLSVPFIALFGLNRFTARVAVVIISLLALWIIYSLVKLLIGRGAALAVMAFCAINPWQIMQSRWALDCNMLPHFFLFSIYFLILALKKNKKFLYLSMTFFGLTMYSYGIAWYTVPLFLAIAGAYLLSKKYLTIKELALSGITYLFIAGPIFGTMLVNTLKLSTIYTPFFTIPYFPGTARTADILFFSKDILTQLISNLKSTLNIVILQKPDLPWNTIPQYGVIYLFSIPFFLLGFIFILKSIIQRPVQKQIDLITIEPQEIADSNLPQELIDNNRPLYVIIILWLMISILSGLIINGVNVNRVNIIFYPMIILSGIGIYICIKRVKLLLTVILLIYMTAFAGFNLNYFGDHSKIIGEAFYEGFGEALEYVEDMDFDEIYVTNWTQSEGSWWVSEPLTLFHHHIDALYFQGKADAFTKKGKKLLPYKERYKYVDIQSLKNEPDKKVVYIVRSNEISKFENGGFKIINFSFFNVVFPSKEAQSSKPALEAGSNLVRNPSFEQETSAMTQMWESDQWDKNAGVTEVLYEKGLGHTGDSFVTIINHSVNDTRFKQVIEIKKDTMYRVTCWIKTEDVGEGQNGKGANISIEGIMESSRDIKGTTMGWEKVELYVKNENKKMVIITIGIGGYGAMNTGKASFDDVSVEEVQRIPEGAAMAKI